MKDEELLRYKRVQSIAKETIDFLKEKVTTGITECEIADLANNYMKKKGVNSFWYHGVGTLVLIGKRTTLSISGRNYEPDKIRVRTNDLVTVDLSPKLNGYWGDLARTFIIQNGRVVETPQKNTVIEGIEFEDYLHNFFRKNIKPEMTFNEMYHLVNNQIKSKGFVNLDFKGNLGHTIEKEMNKRVYIEKDCMTKFSECDLFTFEPHIKKMNGQLGFKREDIYYFSKGKLQVL